MRSFEDCCAQTRFYTALTIKTIFSIRHQGETDLKQLKTLVIQTLTGKKLKQKQSAKPWEKARERGLLGE